MRSKNKNSNGNVTQNGKRSSRMGQHGRNVNVRRNHPKSNPTVYNKPTVGLIIITNNGRGTMHRNNVTSCEYKNKGVGKNMFWD